MRADFYPPSKLIAPLFIDQRSYHQALSYQSEPLRSIPNFFRLTMEQAKAEIVTLRELGIHSFLLYPIIDHRSIDIERDSSAILAKDLFLLNFVRIIKKENPDINLILDLCLCHFSTQSQCGVECEGEIENDRTLTLLKDLALNYAEAGADALMISGMIDGAVKTIRAALEDAQFHQTVLMVQSAKLDSALYGPFQKIQSKEVRFSQKSTYQLEVANARQAKCEIVSDILEGADILVIKPTATSLDFLCTTSVFERPPVLAYTTGGEYALLRQLSDNLNSYNSYFKNLERAGIDAVISYASADYVKLLAAE